MRSHWSILTLHIVQHLDDHFNSDHFNSILQNLAQFIFFLFLLQKMDHKANIKRAEIAEIIKRF